MLLYLKIFNDIFLCLVIFTRVCQCFLYTLITQLVQCQCIGCSIKAVIDGWLGYVY